jgi:uncharacterized membrane protein YedE/YeeE
MNVLDFWSSLSPVVQMALVAVIVVQVVLDVVAFRDLYKRPADQVVFGNKWIWVAVILAVSTVGAILYLAVGHKPAVAAEKRPPRPTGTRTADAADLLYGEKKA